MSIFKYFRDLNKKTYKPYSTKRIMGIAAVKIRIMPSSPDTDLEEIKNEARKLIEDKGKNCQFEEEPVAFGLIALIAFFAWPEEEELEALEEKLRTIEEVNSIQVIDMRRAFG
jgi:elongation factor 1-beta